MDIQSCGEITIRLNGVIQVNQSGELFGIQGIQKLTLRHVGQFVRGYSPLSSAAYVEVMLEYDGNAAEIQKEIEDWLTEVQNGPTRSGD